MNKIERGDRPVNTVRESSKSVSGITIVVHPRGRAGLSGKYSGQSETTTTGSLRIIPTGNMIQVRFARRWSTGQFSVD